MKDSQSAFYLREFFTGFVGFVAVCSLFGGILTSNPHYLVAAGTLGIWFSLLDKKKP